MILKKCSPPRFQIALSNFEVCFCVCVKKHQLYQEPEERKLKFELRKTAAKKKKEKKKGKVPPFVIYSQKADALSTLSLSLSL